MEKGAPWSFKSFYKTDTEKENFVLRMFDGIMIYSYSRVIIWNVFIFSLLCN